MIILVWYGMVWYGMAWHGMAWYGMVWHEALGPSGPMGPSRRASCHTMPYHTIPVLSYSQIMVLLNYYLIILLFLIFKGYRLCHRPLEIHVSEYLRAREFEYRGLRQKQMGGVRESEKQRIRDTRILRES